MNVRIKLPTAIHSVCDKDANRYALNGVLVDTWNAQAAATDGRCLAVAPIEYDGEPENVPPVIVPLDLLKAGGKQSRTLDLNGTATRLIPGKPSLNAQYLDGRFPRLDQIVGPAPARSVLVKLDPELLLKLANALHATDSESKGVCLEIPVALVGDSATLESIPSDVYVVAKESAIAVAPCGSTVASGGLIMPLCTTEAPGAAEPRPYTRIAELCRTMRTDVAKKEANLVAKPEGGEV